MNHLDDPAAATPLDTLALLDPALGGSTRDFLPGAGRDLQDKTRAFHRWFEQRLAADNHTYARDLLDPPATQVRMRQLDGRVAEGLNFSSQDYLALSTHPRVRAAACEAVQRWGVHSAGSTVLSGNVGETAALERELAEHLGLPCVRLFPTGWAAGYGLLRALVGPDDHVLMDQLAHNCLHEGARAATRHVHLHRHLDLDHARRLLQRVRAQHPRQGVLLVTEGCFSMDADTPDLAGLQALAHEHDALLAVDVAHDLGSLGPGGQGQPGLQGLHGQLDIVLGSFSKTFASNGGFVACREPALAEYLRFYAPSTTFSNALSPVQVACVREALAICRSAEGLALRDALMQAVLSLRQALRWHGLEALGGPAPIVPVLLGSTARARLVARQLAPAGLLANLVEYPAVGLQRARVRLQPMASHTPAQARDAAQRLARAIAATEPSEGVETAAMPLDACAG